MKKERELYMYIVGGAIAILFVALTIYLNIIKSPDITYNETLKNIVVLIIGYYWGSSQGSADKTNMMNGKTPDKA